MVLSFNIEAKCKNCGEDLKKKRKGVRQNVEWCSKLCKKSYKAKLKKAKKLMRQDSSKSVAKRIATQTDVEYEEMFEISEDEFDDESETHDHPSGGVSSSSYVEPKPWDSDNKTVTQEKPRISGASPRPRRTQAKKP